jgi:DNA-binding transcriptional MerR regulator
MFAALMTASFRIGRLSERAGVTARTVRYYESIGLVPPGMREGGAQRSYTDETVARLKKIEQLKALGLSLDEVASVIDLYFTDTSGKQAKIAVLAILREHLAEARRRIGALEGFCTDLQSHIDRFEQWLAGHADDDGKDDNA